MDSKLWGKVLTGPYQPAEPLNPMNHPNQPGQQTHTLCVCVPFLLPDTVFSVLGTRLAAINQKQKTETKSLPTEEEKKRNGTGENYS